jgi:hypothetical protein
MENQTQPPYQGFLPQQPLPNATGALVLGIISIVGCFCYGIVGLVCGIIAIVLGNKAVKLYASSPDSYTAGSLSNAKAGKVCGIIGVCLSSVYVVYVIILLATVGTAMLNHPQEFFHHIGK